MEKIMQLLTVPNTYKFTQFFNLFNINDNLFLFNNSNI